MLHLLFYNDRELSDSDVSEEEDGGNANYLIDSPLVASELFRVKLSVRLQLWN